MNQSQALLFLLPSTTLQGPPPLIHLDLYRLDDPQVADELFLQEEEEANAIGALMVIEWPERLGLSLPEAWRLKLKFESAPNKGRFAQLKSPYLTAKNSSTCK